MNNIELLKTIERIIDKSAFYSGKISKGSFSDISDIPFTTKKDIITDQALNPPFGKNLVVPITKIVRIHKTSGTTDKPVIVALTSEDIETTVAVGSRSLRSAGVREDDVVFHCLNYNMWAGGYTDHQSLERAGAIVVPFGVGNTENLLQMMIYLNATGIHCTPSYLSKLEEVCKTVLHISPMDLKLRIGLFGGESGMQNPAFRERIETTWGLTAMNANYGLSEVLSIIGSECGQKNALHFNASNVLFPELIDPVTLSDMPIKEGLTGELVLTNLRKEAQPLLRYRSGDVIKILGTNCNCGAGPESFRFEVIGRSDDMFVYKGLNVFPASIETIIGEFLDRFSTIYQILINKSDPIDTMIVRVELLEKVGRSNSECAYDLAERISSVLGIKPEVEVVAAGTIPRTDGKHKKLLRVL